MSSKQLKDSAKRIQLVALDFDGVLTDGGMYLSADGSAAKKVSFQDIMGLSRWQRRGRLVALVSGEDCPVARAFAAKLSLQHAFFGVKQKADVLRDLMSELHLGDDEVCFMGDDINDIQAMSIAGLAATVPHAPRRVLSVADWLSPTPAGSGAVRELLEYLAEAQGFELE